MFQRGEFATALAVLNQARSLIATESGLSETDVARVQKLNNTNSWNASCILLANQQLSVGWQLFDFGLRAVAHHAQKWQRALPKLYTHDQLRLWRGESLTNKRLFLMEEQAIGDVMQFLTLLPTLLNEADFIGILISDRLIEMYTRSFTKWIDSQKLKIFSERCCQSTT